ncbi:MAG TPA: hypothetical protein VF132_09785 [Rudaea sp.]
MSFQRKTLKTAVLSLALCAALPALADETTTTVTRTDNVKHHYIYYRDHDIYFSPETKTYYWNENGSWQSGNALPDEQRRYVGNGGVEVELDTARPYERNDYVVQHYKTAPVTTTRETTRTTNDDGSMTTTTTTTKHRYVYYSDHDIYFSPETKTYYWRSNGNWTSGTSLPPEDESYVRNKGISIELDTDKPYERHEYVISHYKTRSSDADRQ